MYPNDPNINHTLLLEHLDAVRREAAQARLVPSQPGLLARVRRALSHFLRPQSSPGHEPASGLHDV